MRKGKDKMIYVGQEWKKIESELAALGVRVVEDDHLVSLSCGDEKQVFSALGVNAATLVRTGKEMAHRRKIPSSCPAPTSPIKSIFEWGIACKVCQVMTIHRYIGVQLDDEGGVALFLWGCAVCGDAVAWESPEECGRKAFRLETRRMRDRRSKRRWG